MSKAGEREAARLLAPGLGDEETAHLRAWLEADPERAARLARWERVWTDLDPGVPHLPAPGFTAAVMARVRAEAAGEPLFRASRLVRAMAALALVLGMGLGAVVGHLAANGAASAEGGSELAVWSEPALVDGPWPGAETDGPATGGAGAGERP